MMNAYTLNPLLYTFNRKADVYMTYLRHGQSEVLHSLGKNNRRPCEVLTTSQIFC